MGSASTPRRPEIRVFAGPNGSGKSSLTLQQYIIEPYINADVLKKDRGYTDLEAAQHATSMREAAVAAAQSFTFETVLSTDRNIDLLRAAKAAGYFIRCIFVLTVDPQLNVGRVESRVQAGGHNVETEKIISRYYRSLARIPTLRKLCDRLNIYDNSLDAPYRIFKQRNSDFHIFPSILWPEEKIRQLVTTGTFDKG